MNMFEPNVTAIKNIFNFNILTDRRPAQKSRAFFVLGVPAYQRAGFSLIRLQALGALCYHQLYGKYKLPTPNYQLGRAGIRCNP